MGELEWAELEGLSSASARDAAALSLVKGEALSCFADLMRIFERGQAILYGKHGQDADPAFCRAVRDWLLSAHDGLRRGESLEGLGSVLRNPDRASPQHTDGEVWRRAGFPNAYLDRLAKAEFFGWSRLVTTHLILPCLGPTLLSTVLFAKAFAAETGWNLQPIFDLPKQPIVFRSISHVGLSSQVAWISAFKARAGHEVVARLEQGIILPDADAKGIWALAAEDERHGAVSDGRAIIRWDQGAPGLSVIDAIDMQQRLAAVVSAYQVGHEPSDRLLTYLTFKGPCLKPERVGDCSFVPDTVPLRLGTGFRAIRKTYLNVVEVQAGSVSAMTSVSGTRTTGVLTKQYLNTPSLRACREVSIRLTQEVLQAQLIDAAGGLTIDITVPAAERGMYLAIGRLTGLTAALGMVDEVLPAASPIVRFRPGPDELMALYVLHRELRLSRGRIGSRRWTVQAFPVLALAKAIGRKVFQQNLGSLYFAQARRAQRLLRSGGLTPPAIFASGEH